MLKTSIENLRRHLLTLYLKKKKQRGLICIKNLHLFTLESCAGITAELVPKAVCFWFCGFSLSFLSCLNVLPKKGKPLERAQKQNAGCFSLQKPYVFKEWGKTSKVHKLICDPAQLSRVEAHKSPSVRVQWVIRTGAPKRPPTQAG